MLLCFLRYRKTEAYERVASSGWMQVSGRGIRASLVGPSSKTSSWMILKPPMVWFFGEHGRPCLRAEATSLWLSLFCCRWFSWSFFWFLLSCVLFLLLL